MARCLRCGAGDERLEGQVAPAPWDGRTVLLRLLDALTGLSAARTASYPAVALPPAWAEARAAVGGCVPRQRRWQLDQLAAGRCQTCG